MPIYSRQEMDYQFKGARRDLENIVAAWPDAVDDVKSRGYRSQSLDGTGSSGPSDPTGNAACGRDGAEAEGWVRHVQLVLDELLALANQARRLWPPKPKEGETVDGVKVGERGNTAEVCVECQKVIGADAADPLRRIDQKPYHAKTCFYRAYRRSRNSANGAQQSA